MKGVATLYETLINIRIEEGLRSTQLLSTAYCLGGGSSCSEDGAGQDRHGHAKAQGKEQLESACELQN